MKRKRVEETGSFQAVDSSGKVYTVTEQTEFFDFRTSDGPGTVEGHKTLRAGRYLVRMSSDGYLSIPELGIELKRQT